MSYGSTKRQILDQSKLYVYHEQQAICRDSINTILIKRAKAFTFRAHTETRRLESINEIFMIFFTH
jgi:hypothetical protein